MSAPSGFFSNRRFVTLGGAAAIAGAGYLAFYYTNPSPAVGSAAVSAEEAYSAAQARDILLIDIRRPDEWARTGVGVGALPLDMRRDDFLIALDQITGGDRTRPVAVICARGVRSARMTNALSKAGYSNLIDVPEGMLGSRAGPGWLAKGLPVSAAP